MQPLRGGGKKSPNRLQRQRNGLLALVHIAKKDLGLSDDTYRSILRRYGAASAAAMSIPELEDLMKYFKSIGFRKLPNKKKNSGSQAEALQGKILARALTIENGQARLAGLVKAKCGVDDLSFCRDVGKLKQILKILNLLG